MNNSDKENCVVCNSKVEQTDNVSNADIKELIDKLVKEGDRIIANPEVTKALQKKGLPIHEQEAPTLEEALDRLFAKRKETALEIAGKLPPFPPYQGYPAIELLYEEIEQCILFGLNGAAITLSGILVEFVLKFTTYIREVGRFGIYDSAKWDEFECITLEPAIKRANSAGLITDEMLEKLMRFKEKVRNPYSHFNIKKITTGVVWPNVNVVNTQTGEVIIKDIRASEEPAIQAQVKPIIDGVNVVDVFSFANRVVEHLLREIESTGKDTA